MLVAEDHPIYRYGVVHAIKERPDLELVAECEDGRAALTEIRSLQPDVAVLDLRMRLGEGTGGLLAVSVVQAAARVLGEMATLDEMRVG